MNATLVINDSANFQECIWQTHQDWDTRKWNESLKSQVIVLLNLYSELSETEDYGGGTEELYVLGDVINLLNNIDVKVEGDAI